MTRPKTRPTISKGRSEKPERQAGAAGSSDLPKYALLACIVALMLPLAATAQGKGETVKVQDWPGTGNMLLKVAISKSYCEQQGITCVRQVLATAPLGLQALASKSIDIAMPSTDVAINAIQRGIKLKIIGGAIVTAAGLMVVRNDFAEDKRFPDNVATLRGRKVAVPVRNGSGEVMANLVLAEARVKPTDVTYVAIGSVPDAMNALKTRQVDAVLNVEPAGAICAVEKWCKVLWRGATDPIPKALYGVNGAQVLHITREDLIQNRPHVIAAYQNAIRAAEQFIQNSANTDAVQAIAEQYFKPQGKNGAAITAAALRATLPGYRASVSRDALERVMDLMEISGQLATRRDVASLLGPNVP